MCMGHDLLYICLHCSLSLIPLPAACNIILLFWNTVDFVIPKKGESLLEAYETWRKWADEKGTSACTCFCSMSVLS